MAKLLIDKGADPDILNQFGFTALHKAVEKGSYSMLKFMPIYFYLQNIVLLIILFIFKLTKDLNNKMRVV